MNGSNTAHFQQPEPNDKEKPETKGIYSYVCYHTGTSKSVGCT